MAAPIYPPPSNLGLYIHNHHVIREMYERDFRFQLDDFSNINTMRGPTKGWPAGGVGYQRRSR